MDDPPAASDARLGTVHVADWRPTPFREFVLKIHGSCDLSCDYCYMYTMADQTALAGTRAMRPEIVAQTAFRIGEHVAEHGVKDIRAVLHGGEPLLAGARALASAAGAIRAHVDPGVTVDVVVQSNGVRLDPEALGVLRAAGIRVGVSIDGGRVANDRHRRRANGQSTFDEVHRALDLLRAAPDMYAGILAVIDLANDPVDTYRDLLAYAPPALDFLLPHGNWTTPPPGRNPDDATPYGDWLVAVFDHWFDAGRGAVRIRLFEEIIALLFGFPSHSEMIGLSPVGVIVVNVDGSMEQIDTLRSAYPGAVATGLSVVTDSFDEALRHPAVIERQTGLAALGPVCLSCPVHKICGGGYYPHRYEAGTGFRNPSVFCADLRRLIEHIADRVRIETRGLTR